MTPSTPSLVPTCLHGRPTDTAKTWDWFFGRELCEDCADEDWRHSRKITIVGLLSIAVPVLILAIIVACGMFW